MPTEKSKPFDYAQDVTKQILTLSTAVVTITVTFPTVLGRAAPSDARAALYGAWVLFALAIVTGVATLLNLTGRVGDADTIDSQGIDTGGIRIFATAQVVLFVAAMGATIYFGARSFGTYSASCTAKTIVTHTSLHRSAQRITVMDC